MPKFLAIDYGLERTGLAISDPDARIAFPLRTLSLSRHGTRKRQLDALANVAQETGAEAIVIGLPLHCDGSENLMVRQTRNMAERLKRRLPLPFYWMPEILSSEEAIADLKECGLRGKKLKSVVDQQAACRILSSFLAQPEHERKRL